MKKSTLLTLIGCLVLACNGCGEDDAASGGAAGTADAGGSGGSDGQGGAPAEGGQGGQGGQEGGGGAAISNDWSCLGVVPPPVFVEGPNSTGSLTVVELASGMALADIVVKACAATDVECASESDSAVTNAQGFAGLSVPTNAAHYLELSGDAIPVHLLYSLGPLNDPFALGAEPISAENLVTFVALLGDTPDPERGHLGVGVRDCLGQPAIGVSVTVDSADADTTYGYFGANGTPQPGLSETGADSRIGITNVPAGAAQISATIVATGELIGTRSFHVRAGGVTYPADITPRPEP